MENNADIPKVKKHVSAGRICSLCSLLTGILLVTFLFRAQEVDILFIMGFIIALIGLATGIAAVKMRKGLKSGTRKAAFIGVFINAALICHLTILMSVNGTFFNFSEINRKKCLANLRSIGTQMAYYASCNGGMYPVGSGPKGLIAMRRWIKEEGNPSLFAKADIYYCPSATVLSLRDGGDINSFVYFNGLYSGVLRGVPLVFDRPGNHPGVVNILFTDGEIEAVDSDVKSCAALIELLHSRFGFDDKTLSQLRKKAAEADNPGQKKRFFDGFMT